MSHRNTTKQRSRNLVVQNNMQITVAFWMWWNHLIWCCSHGEKCKKQKKTRRFSKSFTSYLHIRSTSEHNSTRFGKLQCRATSFIFWPFLVIGHVTTLPMTYWMDPDNENHPCLFFLHFFITIDEISFFGYIQWTLKAGPDILHTIHIFCSCFLASQASIWNMQWNAQGM